MRATFILAAICVAVFVVQMAVPDFTDMFVLDQSLVLERPWTIVTSMFLHGSIDHLIFNMFALVMFGLILETIIGTRRFLALYFAGGIIASIVAVILYPATLGASGAIFAVIGALAALRPRMTVWMMGGLPMPLAVAAVIWMLIDLVGLFTPSGIANGAHIAGLVFGVAYGLLLRRDFGEIRVRRKGDILPKEVVEKWEEKYM